MALKMRFGEVGGKRQKWWDIYTQKFDIDPDWCMDHLAARFLNGLTISDITVEITHEPD